MISRKEVKDMEAFLNSFAEVVKTYDKHFDHFKYVKQAECEWIEIHFKDFKVIGDISCPEKNVEELVHIINYTMERCEWDAEVEPVPADMWDY